MKVLFAGTPAAAVPTLAALAEAGHEVAAALTQPPRPAGRGRGAPRPSPVQAEAERRGIPVLAPEDLRAPGILEAACAGRPELGVVVAYGRILSSRWLEALPRGWLNLHFSLLPRWRGAAPVAAAIRAGDAETGVTVFRLLRRLDAGPLLARAATPIGPRETAGELQARLATLGAPLIVSVLADVAAGRAREEAQDESRVTSAPELRKEDGRVDWSAAAEAVSRHVRAVTPWPGATTNFRGTARKRAAPVTLLEVEPAPAPETGSAPVSPVSPVSVGALLDAASGVVACGSGAVRILRLRPAAGRDLAWGDFRNGYRAGAGDRFGE
ncbi:MAG: methionyl-tRNA formyltransferase [Planctomycetales bacterium]|nr:methionyl-tRNA formyltransferase [Planctomycetales bacterium]